MTNPKSRRQRMWKARKQQQNPHGNVKSFDQLADEAGKNKRK